MLSAAIVDVMNCATGVGADPSLSVTRTQTHQASIVKDIESGRPMEFDSMFGAPLKFAQLMNVSTPAEIP
ncbi:MAG: hypothetical protein HY848_05990 [Betaproteobacteria bacterium]|nr:hypothetical protein [Betaproteobacteria bacterium]